MARTPSTTAFVAAFVLMAGCNGPSVVPTPTPAATDSCAGYADPLFVGDPGFQGQNAFGHVLRLVCDFGTEPPRELFRTPGTAGREAAARYLGDSLAGAGWEVRMQGFSGAQYTQMEKGSVRTYAMPGGSACSTDEYERLQGLQFQNVVAERGQGSNVLVLMAHYDSKRFATEDPDPANRSRPVLGANDGASGVGVLAEAARVLPPPPPTYVWRILLVDGEDGFEDCHPLAGSIFHARTLSQPEREAIQGVILLDMVGDVAARYCYAGDHSDFRTRFLNSSRRLGVEALSTAGSCSVLDDHTSFADVGVPALDVIDFNRPQRPWFPPYWHTTSDTPDKLSPKMLGDVGRVLVDVVAGLGA